MDTPPMIAPDAYAPRDIARLVEAAGCSKAQLDARTTLVLACLAGAFIALGGAAYTMVLTGVDATGPMRLVGGLVFSLGLILVILAGAELFTGNVLMVIAHAEGKIALADLLRNWGLVYLGNLAGALGIAVLVWGSGLLEGAMGQGAAEIAQNKAALSPVEAVLRGMLCNMLVCLAVWLSFGARTAAGKILAILWPISAFVLLGLEHSVANMYLLPQGALAGATVSLADIGGNLLWVTLGNIVGGAGCVALAYRLAYLPQVASQSRTNGS